MIQTNCKEATRNIQLKGVNLDTVDNPLYRPSLLGYSCFPLGAYANIRVSNRYRHKPPVVMN